MIIKDVSFEEFRNDIKDKKIFCVGIGQMFSDFVRFGEESIIDKITYIYDNFEKAPFKMPNGNKIDVRPLSMISNDVDKHTVILVTSMYCKSIADQLNSYFELDDIICYLYPVMSQRINEYTFPKSDGIQKIPKKIHWFWFGNGEIPKENQKCIDSWKKYCPDYEIIKWSEKNYDISKNRYMYQAYERKRWGFVPDYARLDVVYNEGGIYLDTDVELCSSLDDLLVYDAFSGFQRNFFVALGLGFGSIKGMSIIKEMRDYYNNIDFFNGIENLTASPIYQTSILNKYGLKSDNTLQIIERMVIFPNDVFDPKGSPFWEIRKTNHTHGIHHYSESWVDDSIKKKLKKRYNEVGYYIKYNWEL